MSPSDDNHIPGTFPGPESNTPDTGALWSFGPATPPEPTLPSEPALPQVPDTTPPPRHTEGTHPVPAAPSSGAAAATPNHGTNSDPPTLPAEPFAVPVFDAPAAQNTSPAQPAAAYTSTVRAEPGAIHVQLAGLVALLSGVAGFAMIYACVTALTLLNTVSSMFQSNASSSNNEDSSMSWSSSDSSSTDPWSSSSSNGSGSTTVTTSGGDGLMEHASTFLYLGMLYGALLVAVAVGLLIRRATVQRIASFAALVLAVLPLLYNLYDLATDFGPTTLVATGATIAFFILVFYNWRDMEHHQQ